MPKAYEEKGAYEGQKWKWRLKIKLNKKGPTKHELGARQILESQKPTNSRNKNRQIEEPLSESSRNENGKVRAVVEKIGKSVK